MTRAPESRRVGQQQEKTVAEVLEAAASLIEPEGRWARGVYEEPKDGECAFCMVGASLNVLGISYLDQEAPSFGPGILGFKTWTQAMEWNDAPGRTQAEVVAKLREAAAVARERGL